MWGSNHRATEAEARAIATALNTLDEAPIAESSDSDLGSVTRVELIDHRAGAPDPRRAFVAYDARVALLRQDDGRTLKVVVQDRAASN